MQSNRIWPLVVLAAGLTGCGRDLSVVPVHGTVTFQGRSVSDANLAFVLQEGSGPAAYAVTDAEGRFEPRTGKYRGMVPGKYSVVVQKDDSVSMKIPDPLPAGMNRVEYMMSHNLVPHSLLPLKYSSTEKTPLHIEVSANMKNSFDLALEGDVPLRP